MEIKIKGHKELTGEIKISGAKNSALALIPIALLSDGVVTIDNVPHLSDITALKDILEYLGAKVSFDNNVMVIDNQKLENKEITEELSKRMRASYYFMPVLLSKFKKVSMFFPGGCAIGARPIDQTLKALTILGGKVEETLNHYTITTDKLVGGHVYLDMPSVGATINTIIAAVKAKGLTIIENAAKEPEIVNVATFLNNMGAKISGAGTSEIRITGVKHLQGCYAEVIPDRIEAGTYVIAGAMAGKNLKISNIIPEHIESLLLKMKEMGIKYELGDDYLVISKPQNTLKPVNVKTLGYPGFATDLQQPLTPLLCMCQGTSILEETIYESRFKNVPYLEQMGANIKIDGRKIEINGPTSFKGCEVHATDLRAGASLVVAALAAEGETTIKDCEHILRGYDNMIEKLTRVGSDIKMID